VSLTIETDLPADVAATLVNPAAYADHRLHDAYRWLRANNPLGIARVEGFDPFWVVTKHTHIQAISRQNDLFHNADRPTTLTTRAFEERVRKITGAPNLVRSLVQMDAPDHPKYRALTQAWFMPVNLGKFEERIRTIARSAVERMVAHGGACDFVADIALGYPLHVIMEILGVPEKDEPRMLKLTQELFGPQDPTPPASGISSAPNNFPK
jgi:cytochrome P450